MTTSLLIDPRTGLLTRVAPQPRDPRMPSAWRGHGATVSRIDRVLNWRADGFGFGAALSAAERARHAAIGEAVERYCGNAVPPGLVVASHAELSARGIDAVDPRTVALYAAEQYRLPGFPFTPVDEHTRLGWASGTDLVTGGEVLVPAAEVYLNYDGTGHGEPPIHSLSYSGIATGPTRQLAEQSALEEIFERDACTIWWASGASTVELDDGGRISGAIGRPGLGTDLTIRLLRIPTDLPAPVVAAFIEDDGDGGPFVAFGSACRSSVEDAATKALMEALGLLQLSYQLADQDSDVWAAVGRDDIEAHVFLPYRADRRYADDIVAEYRQLTDLPAIAQLYQDPRMQGPPLDRLRPRDTVPLTAVAAPPSGEARPYYLRRLAERGFRAVAVDVTTDDVRRAGLTVVRVVVPGLVGNAPPAFPLRGSDRYYTVPAALGWDRVPLRFDDLITQPIPLA